MKLLFMKIRLGLIIKIVVAALIIGLLIWRFWPQSSANLITVDKNAIISFAGIASVSRNENGQPRIDSYKIDNEQQGIEPGAILEIIASTKYQQDFRNLFPWRAESIVADKSYDGRNVGLIFILGEQPNEWIQIQYILIDLLDVRPAECELTSDGKRIKTVKNIDYPYYVNRLENDHIRNFSIITVTFVNTSEAFARLRFDEATIQHNDDDVVARYNMSTFGAHRNHVMLKKGDTGKVGLLIGNDLLDQLRGTRLTIASYLDNNFRECFWDEQSYHISDVCEEAVTFMPIDVSKNIFKKVKK